MTKIISVSLVMFLCWNSHGIYGSEMTREQKIALQKDRLTLVNQMPSCSNQNVVINSKNNKDCCTIGDSSSIRSSISNSKGNITFIGSKGRAVIDVSSSTQQVKVSFLESTCDNNVIINLSSKATKIVVESQSGKSNQQNIVTVYSFGTPCVINTGGACVNVSYPLCNVSSLPQWLIPVAFVGILSFAYWVIHRK